MYINTHCFYIFQFFLYFFYEKKNKTKNKQTKHVKQNKAIHKTRLTQNTKAKHTCNAIKNREGERQVTKSLRAFFLPHLGRTFPLCEPLNRR